MTLAVGPGTEVTLHFRLAVNDDSPSEIDSNFDKSPVTFVFGDGNLLPGFESRLKGLIAGQDQQFVIPPAEAFGEVNDKNVQRLERRHFQMDVALEKGLVVSFSDPGGAERPGVILAVYDEWVKIDFNHPLAGREILFDVKIIEVKPAITH